jgi:peptidoglycan/LPS O-acetylase OafA/YrhL
LVFWSLALFFLQLLIYYVLFACHFISKRRLPVLYAGFLVAFLVYFVFFSGGPHTLDRFRHPLTPIICLFAGTGLYLLLEYFSSKKTTKHLTDAAKRNHTVT